MPNSSPRSVERVCLVALLVLISFICAGIAVSVLVQPSSAITNGGSITTLGVPLTENFDTLASSGTTNTWADNTTIAGLYAQFSALPASPTTYIADAGTNTTGAIHSYGTTGER